MRGPGRGRRPRSERATDEPPARDRCPSPDRLAAYEHCRGLATRVRWFNRWSTQCEAALHEMASARYPLAAELRGSAAFSPEALAEPAPVDLSEAEGPDDPEEAPSATADTGRQS